MNHLFCFARRLQKTGKKLKCNESQLLKRQFSWDKICADEIVVQFTYVTCQESGFRMWKYGPTSSISSLVSTNARCLNHEMWIINKVHAVGSSSLNVDMIFTWNEVIRKPIRRHFWARRPYDLWVWSSEAYRHIFCPWLLCHSRRCNLRWCTGGREPLRKHCWPVPLKWYKL